MSQIEKGICKILFLIAVDCFSPITVSDAFCI